MLRKITLITALTALSATPLYAEQFEILILPDAYFPHISYVSSGDTLVFVNGTGGSFTVTSNNAAWTTGAIANGATATVTLDQNMENQFFHPGVVDENGVPQIAGLFEFGAPPSN